MIQVRIKDMEECEDNNYIFESCWYCSKELTKVENIRVDEDDHYLCQKCSKEYDIHSKKCRDL